LGLLAGAERWGWRLSEFFGGHNARPDPRVFGRGA